MKQKFPQFNFDEEFEDFLRLFLLEVYSNALYHGNYQLHDKISKEDLAKLAEAKYTSNTALYDGLKVVVTLEMHKEGFTLSIRDFGEGFDAEQVRLPEDILAQADRGMFMLTQTAVNSGFEAIQIENLTKRNPPEPGTLVTLGKKFS